MQVRTTPTQGPVFAKALAFHHPASEPGDSRGGGGGGGAAVASCDALNLDRKATLALWIQPDPALAAEPPSAAAAAPDSGAGGIQKPLLSTMLTNNTTSAAASSGASSTSADARKEAAPIVLLGRAPAGKSYSLELVWDDTSSPPPSSANGDVEKTTSAAQSGAAASEPSSSNSDLSNEGGSVVNIQGTKDVSAAGGAAAAGGGAEPSLAPESQRKASGITASATGAVPRFMLRLLVVRGDAQVPVVLLSCARVRFGEWQHVAGTFDGNVVTLVVTQADKVYTDTVAADGSGSNASSSRSRKTGTTYSSSPSIASVIMAEDEERVSGCPRCSGAHWLPHNHPAGGDDNASSNGGAGGGSPQRKSSMQAMQRSGGPSKKKSSHSHGSGGSVSLATAMGDLQVGCSGFVGGLAEIGLFKEALSRLQLSRMVRCGLVPFTCDPLALRPAPHSFPSKTAIAACAARCLAAGFDLEDGTGTGIESFLAMDWSRPDETGMKKMLKDKKSPLKLVQELLGGDQHVDYVEVAIPSDRCLLGLGPCAEMAALFDNSRSSNSNQDPQAHESMEASSAPFVNDAAGSSGSHAANGAPNKPPLVWYDGKDGSLVVGRRRRAYGPPFGCGDVVGVGRSLHTASAFFTLNGAWLGNLTQLGDNSGRNSGGNSSSSGDIPFVGMLQAALATRKATGNTAVAAAGDAGTTPIPLSSIQWVRKHSKLAFDPRCLPYLHPTHGATMAAPGASLDVSFEVTTASPTLHSNNGSGGGGGSGTAAPLNADSPSEGGHVPPAVAEGTWTASLRFESLSNPALAGKNPSGLPPIGSTKQVQGSILLRQPSTPHRNNTYLDSTRSLSWVPFTGVVSGHALYIMATTTTITTVTQSSSDAAADNNTIALCLALPPHCRPGDPCVAHGTVTFSGGHNNHADDNGRVLKWPAVAPVGGRAVLQLTGQSQLSIGPASSSGVPQSMQARNLAATALQMASAERVRGLAVSLRVFFTASSPAILVHGQGAPSPGVHPDGVDTNNSNNLTLSLEPCKNHSNNASAVWRLVASLGVSLDGAATSHFGASAAAADDNESGAQTTVDKKENPLPLSEVVRVQCTLNPADLGTWLDLAVVWSHSSLSLRVNGIVTAKDPCPSRVASSAYGRLDCSKGNGISFDAVASKVASVNHPSAWAWVLGDALVGQLADFRVGVNERNSVEDRGQNEEAARIVAEEVKSPRMPIMGVEDDDVGTSGSCLFAIDVLEDANSCISSLPEPLEPPAAIPSSPGLASPASPAAEAAAAVAAAVAAAEGTQPSSSVASSSNDDDDEHAMMLDEETLPQPPQAAAEPQQVNETHSSSSSNRAALALDLARWRALAAKAASVLEAQVLSCGGVVVSATINNSNSTSSEPRSIRFWCHQSNSSKFKSSPGTCAEKKTSLLFYSYVYAYPISYFMMVVAAQIPDSLLFLKWIRRLSKCHFKYMSRAPIASLSSVRCLGTVRSFAWRPNRRAGAPATLLTLPQLTAAPPTCGLQKDSASNALVGLAHAAAAAASTSSATAPSGAPAAPAAGVFSFGSPSAAPAAGAFSFGSPSAAPAAGAFSFGSPSAAPAAGAFSFGSPSAAPAAGAFSFGPSSGAGTSPAAAPAAAAPVDAPVDAPAPGVAGTTSTTAGAATTLSSGITVVWWCGDDLSAESLGADDDDDEAEADSHAVGASAASEGEPKRKPAKSAEATEVPPAPPAPAPTPTPPAPVVPPPEPMTEQESSALALMLPGATLAHVRQLLNGNGNNVETAVMTMLDWGGNPPSPPPLQPISGPAINAPNGQGSSEGAAAVAAETTSNVDDGLAGLQPTGAVLDFAATMAPFDSSSGGGVPAAAAPAPVVEPPAEVCCPDGHSLKSFQTPNDSFSCDQCQSKWPTDSAMHGCRMCNFDLCPGCWQQRRQAIDDEATAARAAAAAAQASRPEPAAATNVTGRVGSSAGSGPSAARWVEFQSPIKAVGLPGGSAPGVSAPGGSAPDGPNDSTCNAFRAACAAAMQWINSYNKRAAAAAAAAAAAKENAVMSGTTASTAAAAGASAPASTGFLEIVGGIHLAEMSSSSASSASAAAAAASASVGKSQASAGIWVRPSSAPSRRYGWVFLHPSGGSGGGHSATLDAWLSSASVATKDVVAVTQAPLPRHNSNSNSNSSSGGGSANVSSFSLVVYQLSERGLPLLGLPTLGGPLDFALMGHWPLTPTDLRAAAPAVTASSTTTAAGATEGLGGAAQVLQLPPAVLSSSSSSLPSSSSSSFSPPSVALGSNASHSVATSRSALTSSNAQIALVPHWPPKIVDHNKSSSSSSSGSGSGSSANEGIVSSNGVDLVPFMFDPTRSVGCFRATRHGRTLTCSQAPPLSVEAIGAAAPGSANSSQRHTQVRKKLEYI